MRLNIKYSIIVVALIFLSCEDFLDHKPYGQFSDNQLDESSIEGLLAAAYSGLEAHFFGNNEAFTGPVSNWVFDVRSDDAYKGGEGLTMEASITQLELANITSDNPTNLNKWRNSYYGISRVHNAMRTIEMLNLPNKNELLGELRLIRGHFYFDLIRIFERIPYLTENSDPSEVSSTEFTRDEIFSKIKDDFRFAYENLPSSQNQAGRFNKYAAAAYMTKVSVETKDWPTAITYADYVIGSGNYMLYNNYLDMSKIEFENQYESIFAIQFSTANNNAHINWGNLLNTTRSEGNVYGNGDDFFLASQNLVNAFRTNENGLPYHDNFNEERVTVGYPGNIDPRLDFTVGRIGMPFRGKMYTMGWCRDYDTYGEYSGKKGLISPDSPDMVQGFPWGASALNYIVIRYAEVLLWKAEALIESNQNLNEARSLINQVREKAKRSVDINYEPRDIDPGKANYRVEPYPSSGWTQEYARKALRMERRLELAMEGHRWFDLVRWGIVETVMNKYYQEEVLLRPYYTGVNLTSDKIYLPIPKDEVENSGGLYGE